MRTRSTFVYLHLAEGPVPAGRLEMIEDGRNSHATFQYGARYLARRNRVAIDPAALPLPDVGQASQLFRSAEGFALFNGIRDAAPDAWGRYLMQKAADAEALDEFDYLIASGEHRDGALAFGPTPTDGPQRIGPWGDGDLRNERLDLAALADAADKVQSVDRLEPELRRFLDAGSSLGGARPKAATERDGMPWIAKFSAKNDSYPVCRTEFAAMSLARACGLDVPDIDLQSVLGHDIYLIKRFDRRVERNQLHRTPFASALTMLEAQEIAAYHYSYRDLADILRRFGSEPRRDLRELLRRLGFNILVGNDDDHLRNHAFLFDGRGWRLSPLYDVVPKPHVGHQWRLILHAGDSGREPRLANALTSAASFGLKTEEATALLEEMRATVAREWRHALKKAGLATDEIGRLAHGFAESEREDWQRAGAKGG